MSQFLEKSLRALAEKNSFNQVRVALSSAIPCPTTVRIPDGSETLSPVVKVVKVTNDLSNAIVSYEQERFVRALFEGGYCSLLAVTRDYSAYFALVSDNYLLGFFKVTHRAGDASTKVDAFYIVESVKNRGFGRRMFSALEQQAALNGCLALELFSVVGAIEFDKKMGMSSHRDSPCLMYKDLGVPFTKITEGACRLELTDGKQVVWSMEGFLSRIDTMAVLTNDAKKLEMDNDRLRLSIRPDWARFRAQAHRRFPYPRLAAKAKSRASRGDTRSIAGQRSFFMPGSGGRFTTDIASQSKGSLRKDKTSSSNCMTPFKGGTKSTCTN